MSPITVSPSTVLELGWHATFNGGPHICGSSPMPLPDDVIRNICQRLANDNATLRAVQRVSRASWRSATPELYRTVELSTPKTIHDFFGLFWPFRQPHADDRSVHRRLTYSRAVKVIFLREWHQHALLFGISRAFLFTKTFDHLSSEDRPRRIFPHGSGICIGRAAYASILQENNVGSKSCETADGHMIVDIHSLFNHPNRLQPTYRFDRDISNGPIIFDLPDHAFTADQISAIVIGTFGHAVMPLQTLCIEYPTSVDRVEHGLVARLRLLGQEHAMDRIVGASGTAPRVCVHGARLDDGKSVMFGGQEVYIYLDDSPGANAMDPQEAVAWMAITMLYTNRTVANAPKWLVAAKSHSTAGLSQRDFDDIFEAQFISEMDMSGLGHAEGKAALRDWRRENILRFVDPADMPVCPACGRECALGARRDTMLMIRRSLLIGQYLTTRIMSGPSHLD